MVMVIFQWYWNKQFVQKVLVAIRALMIEVLLYGALNY